MFMARREPRRTIGVRLESDPNHDILAPSSLTRTASAGVGPEDGGFSTSLNCTRGRTFWFPTWPDGARCACRSGRRRPTFLSCRIGSAILSPSTAVIDRARKLAIYAREGVAHAWLVDPALRTLDVFRLEGGRYAD